MGRRGVRREAICSPRTIDDARDQLGSGGHHGEISQNADRGLRAWLTKTGLGAGVEKVALTWAAKATREKLQPAFAPSSQNAAQDS
jgi:hypothetical protein